MKVLTILGTRPEIIRLSMIIEKLDKLCDHTVVHTGQNFDPNLSDVFFAQLRIRKPDHFLEVRGGSFGRQMGEVLSKSEEVLKSLGPDKVLILGDTNSGLAAVVAKRLGIPVYHMEAGNRCYDDRVPEEVNRRVIDHSSDVLMPYTERSKKNLLREGIPGDRIYVTGNPIYEVIDHFRSEIQQSRILTELCLEPRRYFIVTMHRAENVDIESRLHSLITSLEQLHGKYGLPVIVSTHPRTRARFAEFGVDLADHRIQFLPPFGFFDFISLEQNAFCVLSDSGTVQEECAIFGVPNVTIRDVTERPETIECGSNILSGVHPETIMQCVNTVLNCRSKWSPPSEYLMENVSDTVIKIVMGFRFSPFGVNY